MEIALASCQKLPDWEVDDRPLVAALEARGARVRTVPWDADIEWSRFAGVLIRTTWDYMSRAAEFLAWVERVGGETVLLNPPRVVRWNLDKRYLADLERRGVAILPTAWIEPSEAFDVAAWLAARGSDAGFLKPVVGASAVGSLRFPATADGIARAQRHRADTVSPKGWILQPYLATVETLGELSAIFVEGEITHAVQKIPLAGDYRVQDDYGAKDFAIELGQERSRLAHGALAAARQHLGLDVRLLYGRADFLQGAAGELFLTELELIEPSLFFRHAPAAAEPLAEAFLNAVRAEREA